MKDWSRDPRILAALALAGFGVVLGLAIGGRDRTVIVSTPAPQAPPTARQGTADATTPTATTRRVFPQPSTGEGVFTVTGTGRDPDTGPSLRAGVPGDARTDPSFPQSPLAPGCELKARARFTVAHDPYAAAYDYTVLSIGPLKESCDG